MIWGDVVNRFAFWKDGFSRRLALIPGVGNRKLFHARWVHLSFDRAVFSFS
jgi:hypothetical protein